MLARIRKSLDNKEEGFTLIELLVVIIIGILAAIAIPVFLSQRKKGYDASVKADLKNAATAEETYLTDNSAYSAGTGLTATGAKLSPNNTLTVGFTGATGFCIVGTNSNSSNFFLYDNAGGGLKTSLYTSLSAAEGACTVSPAPAAWTTVT